MCAMQKSANFSVPGSGKTASVLGMYAYLRASFLADEHDVWYMSSEEVAATFGLSNGESENGSGEGTSFTVRAELSDDWQTVSERMQTELETFAKQQGDKAGSLMQNLPQ